MTKDDALRKVKALLALAESTSEHEATVAREQAVKLRLKHGISDKDLVSSDDEDFEMMGHKIFWYSQRVTPRVVEIRDLLVGIKNSMANESLYERLHNTAHLLRDLNDLLDNDRGIRKGVKQDRDELIRAYYEEQLKEFMHDETEVSIHAHRMAVSYTAMACDLRKDTVERIVGRSEKKMWEAEIKRQQEEAKSE